MHPVKTPHCLLSLATVGLLLVGALHPLGAAWKIDPDFRPLPTMGFSIPAITMMQPDGKFIVDFGAQRLNADGSVDATYAPFHPSFDRYSFVEVSPTGQLVARVGGGIYLLNANGSLAGSAVGPLTIGIIEQIAGFLPDGRFVVFGDFTELGGINRAHVARINPDGTLDSAFQPGFGPGPSVLTWGDRGIRWGAVQADGKVVLFGAFTEFNGIARNQLVRLNADGSVDLTFDPGAAIPPPPPGTGYGDFLAVCVDTAGRVLRIDNDVVRRHEATGGPPIVLATLSGDSDSRPDRFSLTPQDDGSVLVSGSFTHVNGVNRPVLARLHADGTLDENFVPDLINEPGTPGTSNTRHLFFHDNQIYAQTLAGQVVRLNPDGTIDGTFLLTAAAPGTATVRCVAPLADGGVVIGGYFSTVNGEAHPGIARLDAGGELVPTFSPDEHLGACVRAFAEQADGRILVGGSFSTVDGASRQALARLNADGSLDPSFDARLDAAAVTNSISVHTDQTIVVGGSFSSIGGASRFGLARVLPDGSIDPTFANTPDIGTAAVPLVHVLPNDQILVGGVSGQSGGLVRYLAMRLNYDGSIDPAFDTGPFFSPGIQVANASATSTGSVVVSGYTGLISHVPTAYRYDATGQMTTGGTFQRRLSSSDPAPVTLADSQGGIFGFVDYSPLPFLRIQHFADDGTLERTFSPEFTSGALKAFSAAGTAGVVAAGNFVELDGMAYSSLARFVPDIARPRLANISTRGYVGTNDEILIAGFYVAGTEPQRVLIRGIAKNLEAYGVPNVATAVTVQVFRAGESAPMAANSSWYEPAGDQRDRLSREFTRLGAFPLAVISAGGISSSSDAALLLDLAPGGYTVQVSAQTPGIALVEAYDANGVGADRKLVNMSTRGHVGVDDERLIAGFVIGEGTKRVLIRAVGPAIADAVVGTLLDPQLELVRQSDNVVLASNNNWGDNANAADIAAASLQVSGLQLAADSADAALLVDLPAGGYTVVVSGVGATSGIALAEVYEISTP